MLESYGLNNKTPEKKTNSLRQQDMHRMKRSISKQFSRKNWLFNNTGRGETYNSIMYSIISTAQANGLDVEKCLTERFSHPIDTILLLGNEQTPTTLLMSPLSFLPL